MISQVTLFDWVVLFANSKVKGGGLRPSPPVVKEVFATNYFTSLVAIVLVGLSSMLSILLFKVRNPLTVITRYAHPSSSGLDLNGF